MAGGDYHPFRTDPAIERWSTMHATMYERFRFTPKRTRQSIIWGLTVPVLTYFLASYGDKRWELRGRTREDSLLRDSPAAAKDGKDKEE